MPVAFPTDDKGEMRQKYREGIEDQIGALGLVVNAVVLWNTRYLGASLEWLKAMGNEVHPDNVHPDEVPRLSLLRFADIKLRPRRDPDGTDAFETAWREG